jgi:hypothetical protein
MVGAIGEMAGGSGGTIGNQAFEVLWYGRFAPFLGTRN